MVGLTRAKGYLRTQVAERNQQRFAPELVFHVDHSAERGERIDRILDQLHDSQEPGGEPG
jgi:ribosome-binding factor A